MTTPTTTNATLNALIALGEHGRMDRSEDRPCRSVASDQTSWRGEVVGANGRVIHRPRIVVVGQRTFGCTCPDHRKQRGAKGPCKHVLSLAKAALIESGLLALFEQAN
tara:strand:+ start:2090 stop:2413 length:324 start_codon:yes stop_codon:yes gene_type:complete